MPRVSTLFSGNFGQSFFFTFTWKLFLFLVPKVKRKNRVVLSLSIYQCDQVWRNSTALANILKVFGNIFKDIWFWTKFSTHFAQFVCFWAKLYCCKWPNNVNTIWSSGCTDKVDGTRKKDPSQGTQLCYKFLVYFHWVTLIHRMPWSCYYIS